MGWIKPKNNLTLYCPFKGLRQSRWLSCASFRLGKTPRLRVVGEGLTANLWTDLFTFLFSITHIEINSLRFSSQFMFNISQFLHLFLYLF